MTERPEFKRMLVGLSQSRADQEALSLTVRLAELLGLHLLATFVEDASLRDVAALPFVRELRPLGGGWRPIEAAQLAQELDQAAEAARRLFDEVAGASAIETSFSLARGSIGDVIGGLAQPDDIIVIIEPRHPAERVTQQFLGLVNVAFAAAAAVMIVPSRIARTTGPIAAVAAGADDPSISAGLTIAAAADEKLIVFALKDAKIDSAVAKMAGSAGVRIETISTKMERIDGDTLVSDFARAGERLVIMTRGVFDDALPSTIATRLGIPVLVIEPKKTGKTEREASQ